METLVAGGTSRKGVDMSGGAGHGSGRGWVLLLAALAVAVVASGLAAADDQQAAEKPAYSAFNGHQTYKTFCINCHGPGGKGDGYLAPDLRARPSDLTRLARDNGGVYPEERVRASVDGTVPVRGHGMQEMPVWGDVFLWPEGDTPERREHVKRKIGELVEFLMTIQEPPPAK
jgi:mono/diheme cytochrome c family protein